MKTNIVSRILKAAKEENPSLVKLCKQWKPERRTDGKPIVDPVTCVRLSRTQTIFVIVSVSLVTSIGMLFVIKDFAFGKANDSPVFTGFCAYLLIVLFLALFNKYCPVIDDWASSNAKNFVKAIKLAEKRSEESFENFDSFSESASNVRFDIKMSLTNSASEIDDMGVIPWQSKKADAKFEKWKIEHGLLRRLFPELPEDYRAYFPKADYTAECLSFSLQDNPEA